MSDSHVQLGRWRRAVDKEHATREVLKASIGCEQWGFDATRYQFKDGSYLLLCKLTKEWMI